MIEELVKEKREQRDYEETAKIMNAIHEKAKDSYYFEKGRKYLERKKNTKKRVKQEIVNDFICFTLGIVVIIPTILLLIVLC